MKKQILQLMFAMLIAFITTSLSHAAGERKEFLRIGKFEVVPKLKLTFEYNTNVFSEADLGDENGNGRDDPDEEEDDDFIYTLTPGFSIIYPGENLSMDFGYSVGIRRHSDFDNEDSENQNFNLGFNLLTPSQRYKFSAGVKFFTTRDPASDDAQSEEDLVNAERDQLTYYGGLDLLIGRASTVIFKVTMTESEYDKSVLEQENTENLTFGITYLHKYWEKTSLVLGYRYGQLEYPDNKDIVIDANGNVLDKANPGPPFPPGSPNVPETKLPLNSESTSHSANIGLEWDATKKVSGRATVGWTSRSYDESDSIRDDTSTFGLGTSLLWKARERTRVNFSLNRSLDDSAFKLSSFFVNTNFGVGVTQDIGRKMQGDLKFLYSLSDYDDEAAGLEQRTDDKYVIDLGLKYDFIDWLYSKFSYQYQNNSSDLDTRDYVIHKILLTLGTQF